eukprot:TRINITY_DN4221_c0_g1_i1.p1 TRINITY_DN4221_c0_g1~~TRINITY_DN4221_c0_g1_i1.p1  ORF type:complete len:394 (+),score=110.92 TRINITY_DN4221_c0_g1_i1:115-1296(+)
MEHPTKFAPVFSPQPSSSYPDLKVTIFQMDGKKPKEAAEFIDNYMIEEKQDTEKRKSDILIFPEYWFHLTHKIVREEGKHLPTVESNPFLKEVATVVAKHQVFVLLGAMVETEGAKTYTTTMFLDPKGEVTGFYRKRRPTQSASSGAGDRMEIVSTPFGKVSLMLCFDVENADILEENLLHHPLFLLNPTYIPLPSNSSGDLMWSNWRVGMETMARKFEQMAKQRKVTIVRCDFAAPCAMGTSITVAPHHTVYAPIWSDIIFSVFIELDPETNVFEGREPERERTERVDNTGNRYAIKNLVVTAAPLSLLEKNSVETVGDVSFGCAKGTSFKSVSFIDGMKLVAAETKFIHVWNYHTCKPLGSVQVHQDQILVAKAIKKSSTGLVVSSALIQL